MKTSKRNKLLGLALTGGLSLFSASNVFAVANDDIANRATISFTVGGTVQNNIGSSPGGNTSGAGADTIFKEDRVINFTVAEVDGATVTVAPSATLQVQKFTVTNSGNAVQDFSLTAINRTTGTLDPHLGANDIFDVTVTTVVVDNGDGNYVPADDTVTFVDELAIGGTSPVIFIVSTIPDDTAVSNNDVAVMALVAQVAEGGTGGTQGADITNDDNGNVSPGGSGNDVGDDPTTMETVFNDPIGTVDSTGAAGAAKNGQHAADHSYTVQNAILTVTKTSVALYDPFNAASNPKSIPGGYVTYTISVANAALAADAALTTLSDVLVASLILDPDFVTNAGPGNPTSGTAGDSIQVVKGGTTIYCTGSTADTDGCGYTGGAGGTITVDLSNAIFSTIMPLAATETVTIKFNVIVQ